MDFEIKETRRLHDGHLKVDELTLAHRLYNGHTSVPIHREVVRRREAVAVLLVDRQAQKVVVVEQFRVGAIDHGHPWVIEPVAGLLEPGEDPVDCVRREIEEETGLCASDFTFITRYFSSVGGSNEVTHLYAAEVTTSGWDHAKSRGLATEGEDIRPVVMNLDELLLHVTSERIVPSSLMLAAQWLQIHGLPN